MNNAILNGRIGYLAELRGSKCSIWTAKICVIECVKEFSSNLKIDTLTYYVSVLDGGQIKVIFAWASNNSYSFIARTYKGLEAQKRWY